MIGRAVACGAVILLAGAAGGSATGCSALCSEDRQVVEVEYGDLQGLQRAHLNILKSQGYACRDDGAIRNVFGNQIGIRYVCTKCD